jgi:hypothetical protein
MPFFKIKQFWKENNKKADAQKGVSAFLFLEILSRISGSV